MRCLNHPDKHCVAVCKACGKGLCEECIEEYKNFMICKESECCREQADCINSLIDKNGHTTMALSIIFGLMALVFFFVAIKGFVIHAPAQGLRNMGFGSIFAVLSFGMFKISKM